MKKKIKMKKLIMVALMAMTGIFFLNTSYAQDPKAKSILNKVSAKMKSAKSLKANFSLAMKDAKGSVAQNISGVFFMKGNKYRVNAGAQEIICDAKSVWTYLKKNNEVQISPYVAEEQAISPAKLFSGVYEKEFHYSYKGSKTFSGKTVDVIELKPKTNMGFSRAELYVDPSGNIAGGNIFEPSGSSYAYTISDITPNVNIADAQFSFDEKAHPGVEVIDLR